MAMRMTWQLPIMSLLLDRAVYIASQDGLWVQFAYDQITSLEALLQLE